MKGMQPILINHCEYPGNINHLMAMRIRIIAQKRPSATPTATRLQFRDLVDSFRGQQRALMLLVPRLASPLAPRGLPARRRWCPERILGRRYRRVGGVLREACFQLLDPSQQLRHQGGKRLELFYPLFQLRYAAIFGVPGFDLVIKISAF